MIRIGLVGIGFMGWIHYLAYKQAKGVKLQAICTRNEKRLAGDWRGIQGNFGPPGEQVDLKGIARYRELSELLADPAIDAVDLCLPPHLHADAAIQALRAGKHVFVEKPMALSVAQCERMIQAGVKAGKQVLVGHVLPFFPEFAAALKIAKSGKYGKPIGGYFKRVISDPLWLKDFYNPERVGGPLIDLHVHDAHFIRLLFGMPTSVVSQGRMRGEVVEFCNTQFQFEDPSLVVSATGGVVNQQGRPFTHAFEIHLEKASLFYEASFLADGNNVLTPLTLLDPKGKVQRPALPTGDPSLSAFEAEIKEFAAAVKSGQPSAILSGALARDAILLCQKQSDSVQRGKPVRI